MKKGIFKVLIFYGTGFLLTWLTYEILGEGQQHGPGGVYTIILLLTFLLGLFWTGSTIYDYYFKDKTDTRKGIIYANTFVFLILFGTSGYIRVTSQYNDLYEHSDTQLTTGQKGDTISIEYNGTTIYLQIKDSIYIDKRDSITGTVKK
jgi:hypothetical protein